MNYKEQLIKNYILSEIYSIEKKDLLEEGKIFNWFKSKFSDIAGSTDIMKKCKEFLEKTKYKNNKKTLRQRDNTQMALELEQNKRFRFKIFALAVIMTASLVGRGIVSPTDTDYKEAQSVAEQTFENRGARDHYDNEDNEDNIVVRQAIKLGHMSEKERQKAIKILFGLDDSDFEEQEESSQPQQASKDYFYDWLETTPKISDINEMTPEQYDAYVKQFAKFLEKEAFKMNKSEANNAQNLLFLLKNSDHATSGTDEGALSNKTTIRTLNSDLEAVQSFKSTIDHFGDMYGLEADQEGMSPEKAKAISLYMQKQGKDKLENLSYIRSRKEGLINDQ